jgi:hypothetical protein
LTKQPEILNSWKEIVGYVDRGVRTIQRWEKYGFPVHRPSGKVKGSVYALKPEVDDWLHHGPIGASQDSISEGELREIFEIRLQRVRTDLTMLRGKLAEFREAVQLLGETLERTNDLIGQFPAQKKRAASAGGNNRSSKAG